MGTPISIDASAVGISGNPFYVSSLPALPVYDSVTVTTWPASPLISTNTIAAWPVLMNTATIQTWPVLDLKINQCVNKEKSKFIAHLACEIYKNKDIKEPRADAITAVKNASIMYDVLLSSGLIV